MDVQKINNVLAVAKDRLNAGKGLADGRLQDSITAYNESLTGIISQLITEIAEKDEKIKKLEKPDEKKSSK